MSLLSSNLEGTYKLQPSVEPIVSESVHINSVVMRANTRPIFVILMFLPLFTTTIKKKKNCDRNLNRKGLHYISSSVARMLRNRSKTESSDFN